MEIGVNIFSRLFSGGNKVRAFNGWSMPLLAYTFGIVTWSQIRKLLMIYRMHGPRSSVMRLYPT